MLWLRVLVWLLAALTIVGGIAGFSAGSKMSLIGGVGVGALLIFGGYYSQKKPSIGFGVSALGCLLLLGQFIPGYIKTQHVWPALIMSIAAGGVLIAHVVGHFMKPK